ncbi:MAG: hypothetical protein GY793_01340 [Proteobacteria bacterium]|nr:hypothetical protein [Pseudomonadota bacterium]
MDITNINTGLSTSNRVQVQSLSNKEQMDKAAKEFESFFVYTMLEQTQPEVDVDSPFSGGSAEQAFRPILNEHIAKEIVESGGIGLKDSIINQINKYQEVENNGR